MVPGGIDPTALPNLTHKAYSAHKIAATVSAVFAIAGLAWVFFTDVVLYSITRDRVLIARVETAKGWIFISLVTLLLYAVTFRSSARLDRVRRLTTAAIESIGDGVMLLGRDRVVAYANPAAERMLRCASSELIGMGAPEFSRRFRVSYPDGALVPPEQFASQRVFDEGGPLQYMAVLHPPGGPDVVISVTAAGVRMQVGESATWVVSVMHDVTASDQLDRMRDQFFAAAAHSLKTPVAIVKADVQALLPYETREQRRVADSIARQCDRIDRLIQNLLVLTRAHSHSLELHPSAMHLRPLIERISVERTWSHRHDLRTDLTGSLPLHADPERIGLAIRNLLYEAYLLSPADSRLTLLARAEGDRVAVGVRYQPLPWHGEVVATYGEYDDIGIGRAVAQAIVERHGGSLNDEETESEKTCWIYLPTAGALA